MESRSSSKSSANRSPLKIDATCSDSGNNAIPDTSVSSTTGTSGKVDAKPNSLAKNRSSLLKSLFRPIKSVPQTNNEVFQHSPGNKRDCVTFGNVESQSIGWAELAETISGIVCGKQAVQDSSKSHGLVSHHVEIMAEYAQTNQLTFGFRPVNFLATELIAAGYPTKGLNIKGKSAEWGPMGGLIPVSQKFSKLTGSAIKISESNAEIMKCIKDGHAITLPLKLDFKRLENLRRLNSISFDDGVIGEAEIVIRSTSPKGENWLFEGRLVSSEYEIFHENEALEVLGPVNCKGERLPFTADYDLFVFGAPMTNLGSDDNVRRSMPQEGELFDAFKRFNLQSPASGVSKPSDPAGNADTVAAHGSSANIHLYPSLQEYGACSPRQIRNIEGLNAALVAPGGNRIIHHGPDSQNDNTDPSQNFPSVIFVPVDSVGAQSRSSVNTHADILMVENEDAAAAVIRQTKERGFHVFGNFKWGSIFRNNSSRSSFSEAQAQAEARTSPTSTASPSSSTTSGGTNNFDRWNFHNRVQTPPSGLRNSTQVTTSTGNLNPAATSSPDVFFKTKGFDEI